MPKLSPLHWIALVVLLLFYGFTVFALTRDYYLRHPVQPLTASGSMQSPAPSRQQAMPGVATSAIPESISESNPQILHQQADELFVQRRFEDAARVYARILELNPDDAEGYNDLGMALHYMGDTSGALVQLRIAVTKDPNLQRPWLTLGFLSLQADNQTEARDALERARDLAPDSDVGQEAARLLGLLAPE